MAFCVRVDAGGVESHYACIDPVPVGSESTVVRLRETHPPLLSFNPVIAKACRCEEFGLGADNFLVEGETLLFRADEYEYDSVIVRPSLVSMCMPQR